MHRGGGPRATTRAALRAVAATAWRGVAGLAALALLDPQQHALGIDVADPQRDHLRDTQPGAPGLRRGRLLRWQVPPCTSAPAPPAAAAQSLRRSAPPAAAAVGARLWVGGPDPAA